MQGPLISRKRLCFAAQGIHKWRSNFCYKRLTEPMFVFQPLSQQQVWESVAINWFFGQDHMPSVNMLSMLSWAKNNLLTQQLPLYVNNAIAKLGVAESRWKTTKYHARYNTRQRWSRPWRKCYYNVQHTWIDERARAQLQNRQHGHYVTVLTAHGDCAWYNRSSRRSTSNVERCFNINRVRRRAQHPGVSLHVKAASRYAETGLTE